MRKNIFFHFNDVKYDGSPEINFNVEFQDAYNKKGLCAKNIIIHDKKIIKYIIPDPQDDEIRTTKESNFKNGDILDNELLLRYWHFETFTR